MLSVIGFLNCIRFIFIKLEGGKWPIWPCFFDVQQTDLPIWSWVTVVKQKKYMPILAMDTCRVTKQHLNLFVS